MKKKNLSLFFFFLFNTKQDDVSRPSTFKAYYNERQGRVHLISQECPNALRGRCLTRETLPGKKLVEYLIPTSPSVIGYILFIFICIEAESRCASMRYRAIALTHYRYFQNAVILVLFF